jgi:hypothetical protein
MKDTNYKDYYAVFFWPPVASSLLGVNVPFSILLPNTPNFFSTPNFKNKVEEWRRPRPVAQYQSEQLCQSK